MFTVRYAALEAALMATYRVPQDEGRFRGRLAALQKAGLFGIQPGKGYALTYGPEQFHRAILGMELTEVGVTPAVIIKLLADLWDTRLREVFAAAETAAVQDGSDRDIILHLNGIALMSGTWSGSEVLSVNSYPLSDIGPKMTLAMRQYGSEAGRAVVINLSQKLRDFHNALADAHLKFEAPEAQKTEPAIEPIRKGRKVRGKRRRQS